MNRKQVIEFLKMENDLICFNPLTGEEIPLEFVNDLNRKCYDAHCRAITFIQNSIPIEWIERKLAEHWYVDYDIRELLEDWEKENEKGN